MRCAQIKRFSYITQSPETTRNEKKKSNMLPNHSPAVIKYDITCAVINILNLFTTVQDLQIGLMSD